MNVRCTVGLHGLVWVINVCRVVVLPPDWHPVDAQIHGHVSGQVVGRLVSGTAVYHHFLCIFSYLLGNYCFYCLIALLCK